MKQFFIITNSAKDPKLISARRIESYLKEKDCCCSIFEGPAPSERGDFNYTDPLVIPEGTECILVLGGDGTLLQAARDTYDLQIPLFGINLGTLGFLAEVGKEETYRALDHMIRDEYMVESRMMLEGRIYRDGDILETGIALNDIVIGKDKGLKALHINNYVDGVFLNNIYSDGIILASPTGSTAYSLSAGGPIVAPNAQLFVMTPLAPHTISTRSVILAPESNITVEICPGREGQTDHAQVYFDGEDGVALLTGDRVVIRRAEKDTRLIKIHNTSFMTTLSRKMNIV